MKQKKKIVKGVSLKEVKSHLKPNYKSIILKYFIYVKELELQPSSYYQREYISYIFLYYLQINDILILKNLQRENIINFLNNFSSCSKFTIKDYVAMLKVFLEFLYLTHFIKEPLYLTLPKIHTPKKSKIPSVWDTQDIKKLFSNINRETAIGKRDYAILLLITKLGLRKTDVIKLKFENINWNNKTINLIQQKTKEPLTLPLLNDVGWAIIDYIQNGRPKSDIKNIFLTHTKEIRSFSIQHGNLGSIVYKYMKKAEIPITKEKKNGVHSLRHTLASEMLKGSTPVQTISSVLGHVNTNATSVYLKIDIEKLRECLLEVK